MLVRTFNGKYGYLFQVEMHKMAAKRSFSADDIPTKSADYHGIARFSRTSPDVAGQGVKSINVYLTFEEALRLSLAVQSCVMNLNRYDRASSAGRKMGMLLSLQTRANTITVIETAVSSKESSN